MERGVYVLCPANTHKSVILIYAESAARSIIRCARRAHRTAALHAAVIGPRRRRLVYVCYIYTCTRSQFIHNTRRKYVAERCAESLTCGRARDVRVIYNVVQYAGEHSANAKERRCAAEFIECTCAACVSRAHKAQ